MEDKETLGKLQPNSLTVDNLTVDWLRTRLNDLECSVKDCQEKQSKLQTDNGSAITPSPISNGISRKDVTNKYDLMALFIAGRQLTTDSRLFGRYSKDFNSLRCHEKQMHKLADLIKTALNEVGCEELPSGCDDISVDQGFIENNMTNPEQPVNIFL